MTIRRPDPEEPPSIVSIRQLKELLPQVEGHWSEIPKAAQQHIARNSKELAASVAGILNGTRAVEAEPDKVFPGEDSEDWI